MRLSFPILLAAILPAIGPVVAQETTSAAIGQPLPLAASLKQQVVPNRIKPLQHLFMHTGTNYFAAQLPDGYRMQNDTVKKRILFPKSDNLGWLGLQIFSAPSEGGNWTSATCREWLSRQYPGANITPQSIAYAAGQGGPLFDLRWTPPGVSQQSARVAFIPSAAGVIIFTLNTPSSQFGETQYEFNHLLLGFRVCPDGKFELPPVAAD